MSEKSIFTKAVHAGEDPERHHGAVSTPIYNSTVFKFPDLETGADIHNWRTEGFFYGRLGNPTQQALERAVCELESGEDALCFASGMAAIAAATLTFVKHGDHMVVPEAVYATTGAFFRFMEEKFGISSTFVNSADPENYRRALKPETKLLYIETPSNPTCRITDISAVAAIAKEHGVSTICDNTFATPFNQNPLLMGCDVVIHSATKYLGGHSDLSAGIVVGGRAVIERARHGTSKLFGGSIAPEVAWLVMRGIKTLPLRMERHNSNAERIASFLAEHPNVVKVFHPSLTGDAGYEIAKRQMRGFGAMLSFDLGSYDAARRFLNQMKVVTLATSLGGVETLAQHSASMTAANVPQEEREKTGITDGLIRMSVGIEDVNDLISDIDQALQGE